MATTTKGKGTSKAVAAVPDNGTPDVVADLDLDGRERLTVKLGGQLWFAVEPTIDDNKKIARALPTIREGETISADAAVESLESIYPQVREVLRHAETGEAPSREFVEKNLTASGFGKLMDRLGEERKQGNG